MSDFATGAGTFSFLNKLKWQQLGRLRRAAIDSSDGTYLQQNPLLQPPDLRHQFDSVFALEKMLGARGRYVWETWTYPAPAAWLEPLPRPAQDQDNGIDPERFINSLGGDRLGALHTSRVFALDSGHPLPHS